MSYLLQIVSNFKEVMKSIVDFISALTPIGIAYIAYLQIRVRKKQRLILDTQTEIVHGQEKIIEKQDAIHEEMNGMKDALVASEKVVSKQEGKDEERSEQTQRNIEKDQIEKDNKGDKIV